MNVEGAKYMGRNREPDTLEVYFMPQVSEETGYMAKFLGKTVTVERRPWKGRDCFAFVATEPQPQDDDTEPQEKPVKAKAAKRTSDKSDD